MKVLGIVAVLLGGMLILAGIWNVNLGSLFGGKVVQKKPHG